ncbi:hypothetical protein GCM10007162_11710 [Ignatzschineria ureiclastica]|uniref:DNA-processing protein DprA n=1 Tax=Ignatzschineria ureiclastica TaxID=472582 RepID=UPI001300AF51|nr:DNA-processing protein DprA [Ignatzschineria ureiclastica]GGZ97215.1 hypothetical protein GCM10007162_11710 [Ignatzschineria ureiclastica]
MSQGNLNILYILALPSIGQARARDLISMFEVQGKMLDTLTPKEIFEAAQQLWPTRIQTADFINWKKQLTVIEGALQASQENGVLQVNLFEENYPPLLRFLKNPPLILHYQGNIDHLQQAPLLTWIGTRSPYVLSQKLGMRIAQQCVEADIHIVSGLAEGSDAIGHQAAVDAKKPTTAILAHGLQQIYPSQHRALAESILENDGALISESLWGTLPHQGLFVRRDLLQAGMSDATFVLETTLEGGSIHAMKGVLSLKRPLLALRYSQDMFNAYCNPSVLTRFTGNNHYIREGLANAVENSTDLQHWIAQLQGISQQRHCNIITFNNSLTQESFDW